MKMNLGSASIKEANSADTSQAMKGKGRVQQLVSKPAQMKGANPNSDPSLSSSPLQMKGMKS